MPPLDDRVSPLQPVLRIAFAGARRLPCPADVLTRRCITLFDQFREALENPRSTPSDRMPPRLVLLSGLSDGADQLAASAFLTMPPNRVVLEHVAVLPFHETDYRNHSPIDDKAGFDRLIGLSSLVIELDGRWLPNEAPKGEAFARHARGRAYRAQARAMLQRSDLAMAVWDPAEPGRPGGTAETVHYALEMGMTVLALCPSAGPDGLGLHALRTFADLDALQSWYTDGTTIPVSEQPGHVEALVRDLLPDVPPHVEVPPHSRLENVWRDFEKKFDGPIAATAARAAVPITGSPFYALRQHARELNARYSGRYRGGFLNNFRFATLATSLAAASLAAMVLGYKFLHSDWPVGLKVFLLLLACGKLALVVTIWRVIEHARHNGWNERAVNARYLAENLRLLFWLPAMGKLRTPQRSGEHHSDQQLGRRTAEALLRAAVRAAPLETGLAVVPGAGPRRARIEPGRALDDLCSQWIVEQHAYHLRNADRLGRMAHSLSHRAEVLNMVVIGCVALDIALLIAGIAFHNLPIPLEVLKVLLIASAAALPAAVAATYGVREQSEAQRLSGRSQQLAESLAAMKTDVDQLRARMRQLGADGADPGAWTLECLDRAERCARLVAEDVAEWSVLYGKPMPAI